MDMTPMIRTNVDYVFALRDNVRQNRENLYKAFFGVFPSFDTFCQVMDSCTENYECLVLDNTSKSNRIQDMHLLVQGADPTQLPGRRARILAAFTSVTTIHGPRLNPLWVSLNEREVSWSSKRRAEFSVFFSL